MNTTTMNDSVTAPRLIAWELTRACYLACRHCRASALSKIGENELSTYETKQFIDNIKVFSPKPILILTGGEPLMRPDIYEIAQYSTSQGFNTVLATCGYNLDVDTCKKLNDCGIHRISLSLDGATAESHDSFRGVNGAFDHLLKATEAANCACLKFQINTTVTKSNVHELPAILDFAIALGAVSFHPFILVPTGRGREISDQQLSPAEYEETLLWIYNRKSSIPITLKPTCAPQYYRIVRQEEARKGIKVTPATHGMDAMTKGCLGGQGFAFVSHTGSLQICGFLDVPGGNLRDNDFDFVKLWNSSDLFCQVRSKKLYKGKCGVCEYWSVCGGCRARAYAMTGDYLNDEPSCNYEPVSLKKINQNDNVSIN